MILVDTSVIAGILTKDGEWFEWSSNHLNEREEKGPVCYNPIIFAELSVQFDTQKELENRLSAFTFLPLPLNAAFQAGKAFGKYRQGAAIRCHKALFGRKDALKKHWGSVSLVRRREIGRKIVEVFRPPL